MPDPGTVGPAIHAVKVVGNRFECTEWCPSAGPHISEYRASRVRPTAKQTADYRTLDSAKGALRK